MDDLLFNPFSDDLSSPTLGKNDPFSDDTSTPAVSDETPAEPPSHIPDHPTLSSADIAKLRNSLHSLRTQIDSILDVLAAHKPAASTFSANTATMLLPDISESHDDQRVLEGIFDGEKMIGDDGEIYTIPPNYASKSKLVEGDRLKLTITQHGSFIYKQVKPINRKRLVGEMVLDQELHQWGVFAEGRLYKVLKASVTFYKGNVGDEAVILVAEDTPCTWGAIENIIHK